MNTRSVLVNFLAFMNSARPRESTICQSAISGLQPWLEEHFEGEKLHENSGFDCFEYLGAQEIVSAVVGESGPCQKQTNISAASFCIPCQVQQRCRAFCTLMRIVCSILAVLLHTEQVFCVECWK